MIDYIQTIFNGLFTGIGVLLAHEFIDLIKHYRNKINNKIDEIDKRLKNEKQKTTCRNVKK